MAINLAKGQKIDLTKGNPGLGKLLVGLGWDTNSFDTSNTFDLDAVAFLVGQNGKITKDNDFIFYGNLLHGSNSVEHLGDNLTGEGDGDDEQVTVNLASVPENIDKIVFGVTIYDAVAKNQNFGQVENAYIRVVDTKTNEELIRYDLGEDFSIETAIVVGEIYKDGSEWKFNAIGAGFQGGLAALCGNYGVDVA